MMNADIKNLYKLLGPILTSVENQFENIENQLSSAEMALYGGDIQELKDITTQLKGDNSNNKDIDAEKIKNLHDLIIKLKNVPYFKNNQKKATTMDTTSQKLSELLPLLPIYLSTTTTTT